MSTSPIEGRVRFDPADYGADAPLSTHHAQVLLNNALHYADEAGQVRVAWELANDDGGDGYLAPDTTSASVYQLIWKSGPWPATLRADGSPYRYRVRLKIQSQTTGQTVTFRCAIAPANHLGLLDEYARNNTAPRIETFTTSSTTAAWVDGGSDNLIALGVSDGRDGQTSLTVQSVANSGVTVGVEATMLELGVYAIGSAEPRLSGVYAAEYIGT